jgi:hypothetical protein
MPFRAEYHARQTSDGFLRVGQTWSADGDVGSYTNSVSLFLDAHIMCDKWWQSYEPLRWRQSKRTGLQVTGKARGSVWATYVRFNVKEKGDQASVKRFSLTE